MIRKKSRITHSQCRLFTILIVVFFYSMTFNLYVPWLVHGIQRSKLRVRCLEHADKPRDVETETCDVETIKRVTLKQMVRYVEMN